MCFLIESRVCDGDVVLSLQDSLCCGVIFISYHFSALALCVARRGLWSEGDAPAEVPAPGERDPGTHSGGGCHPGEVTARHTHALTRTPPLPMGLGKGWYTLFTQPLSCCPHTNSIAFHRGTFFFHTS